MKCFLLKAEHYKHTRHYKLKHQTQQESYFLNTSVALNRMENDVTIIREYFESVAVQNDIPALCLLIEKEFQILTIVQELIRIANDTNYSSADCSSNSSISSYYGEARNVILVLHKQLKDVNVTKCVVSDIWHLIHPSEEIIVWKMMKTMEKSFVAVCPPEKRSSNSSGNGNGVNDRVIAGLQICHVLAKHYSESKRKRPLSSGNNIRMMMMQSMKKRVGNKQTTHTRKRTSTSGGGGQTPFQIETRV